MKLYTVRDELAEEYGPLFEQKNDATAKRSVELMLKDKPYPADYSLYCVGEFDHDDYRFLAYAEPEKIEIESVDADEVMDRLVQQGKFQEVKKDGK